MNDCEWILVQHWINIGNYMCYIFITQIVHLVLLFKKITFLIKKWCLPNVGPTSAREFILSSCDLILVEHWTNIGYQVNNLQPRYQGWPKLLPSFVWCVGYLSCYGKQEFEKAICKIVALLLTPLKKLLPYKLCNSIILPQRKKKMTTRSVLAMYIIRPSIETHVNPFSVKEK